MFKFITAQICGLLLISFIIYLTNKQKTLHTKSLYAYKISLYATFFSLCLDIASVILIFNMNMLPLVIVNIFCKLYLFSLVVIAFFSFNYLMTNLFYIYNFKKLKALIICVLFASVAVIASNPIKIYFDGNELYTYGNAVAATYASALFFILFTYICTFLFSKQINKQRTFSVRLWLSVWLVAAFIQLFNNELLLIGFATALGLTLVFGEIENPISYIDTESGLYNLKAIKTYAGGIISNKESVYGVCVLLNTFMKTLTPSESNEIITHIANFFNSKYSKAFRIDSYSFIIMCEKDETERYFNEIYKFFNEMENDLVSFNGINVHYGVIKDDNIFDNLEDITNTYYYLKTVKDKEITYVDKKLLDKLKNIEYVKHEIQIALDEDRVEVFYQPIYDNRTKKFNSAEALVRIKNMDGSIMNPGHFIPVAESSGLVVPLGQRVFEKVCQFISENSLEKYGIDYIEVNLSALQFKQPDLFEIFSEIMNKYNVRPNQINFELTESVQLFKSNEVNDTLEKFLNLGTGFSLDDFGTGNSNLDYMASMPINIVKFDFKMTHDYFSNKKTETIVNHIVPMIQNMNFEIVCEGIEDEYQLKTMQELGIEHIQGYYFSKPLPENDFIEFLQA